LLRDVKHAGHLFRGKCQVFAERIHRIHQPFGRQGRQHFAADMLDIVVGTVLVLQCMTEEDAIAMAAAGIVAVLLPGAFYFLRETQLPPMEALRKHGVKIAIASDLNPGTSPALSVRLMLNMACTLFRMTPEEALAGATQHAATALGMGPAYSGVSSDGRFRSMTNREYSADKVLAPNSSAKSYSKGICQSVSGKLCASGISPAFTAGVRRKPA